MNQKLLIVINPKDDSEAKHTLTTTMYLLTKGE